MTGPARMADFFSIGLPRPRTLELKTQEQFGEFSKRIYRELGMT
jgi:NitT/TauT family transport system ATP-binding protein